MFTSSEQFQAAHDSIYVTGRLLLQYLQEIRAGRLSEGDDTKGLQSVEDDISKALKALKDQKYQVAVIAAMKAGKSTFLNALIGADVLASEAEACTVCRTDVRHIEAGLVPKLLEYRQGETHHDTIAEGNAGSIRQKFLERTHEIRDRANCDQTTRFELWHPIEAISKLSSLAGFTLVDTPGPNEWKSARFNTVALKQTALEALRTCDAILFVLDYTSFRDNTNSELLEKLIKQRQEFLAENTGKIYFILNKVDRKSERDREIADVIKDLRMTLIEFGIPEPTIYPVSAWQGLLAKLIQQGVATDSQKKDFKKFFSANYAVEDESGGSSIPPLSQIAPQALKDSFIPTVEETVIQTIFRNSGWNLLSDALRKIDNAAKAIENTLNTDIRGWAKKLEELKQIVEEYKTRSEAARSKVEEVKKSVTERKKELVSEFKRKLSDFSERAKLSIENEFEQFASSRASESKSSSRPNYIPIEDGNLSLAASFSRLFSIPSHLLESLRQLISDQANEPYKIRVDNQRKAEQVKQAINDFCAPLVKRWWLETQNEMVVQGNRIRGQLVRDIQKRIQEISDELSRYLGEVLEVELNFNSVQFPGFEFEGIDAKVKREVEIRERIKKRDADIFNSHCFSSEYVTVREELTLYEIDLRQVLESIKRQIDANTSGTQSVVERVIENQVKADFRSAEQQINDYINRFQAEFDHLLRERETKEAEADQIRATLEAQKAGLNEHLRQLTSIRVSLDTWKPAQKSQLYC